MFISFEGIEGSGKTTQIRHVNDFLESRSVRCIVTREPGGTAIGRRIRAILLDPGSGRLDPLAELLLYMADRAQHLSETVHDNLARDITILCDRFFDATLVYQGYARGLDIDLITMLHRQVFADLKPELTFLLDLPPEEGLARAWRQIDDVGIEAAVTRFEEEKVVFHEKVREGYLTLARCEPARFVIIDATANEVGVREQICSVLTGML